MCLQSTKISLDVKRGRTHEDFNSFYGIGYKALESSKVVKGWRTANFFKHSGYTPVADKINDDSGNLYWPGFHIWLKREDAESYAKFAPGRWPGHFKLPLKIYEVEYKQIVGYGQNWRAPFKYGDCVITRKMRIVKEIV